MLVYVNGVVQVPGIDYLEGINSISFSSAPSAGSTINIQGRNGTLASILGDGFTYLFQFFNDTDHDTTYMLEEAFKLRDIPAVADMLERLKVVVELAKQERR